MYLKTIFYLIYLVIPVIAVGQQLIPSKDSINNEQRRLKHFREMDSLVNAKPNDTFYKCLPCIEFVRAETHIASSGSISFLGQFLFTKEDLAKWKEWYKKRGIKIKD